MKNILIVYDTIEGQTKKIADAIADKLKCEGHWVKISKADNMVVVLKSYDAIIVGGPVHMQRYPKNLENWISLNAYELRRKKTSFFSVCLGILQNKDTKVQNAEIKIVKNFLKKHAWNPDMVEIFAGSLAYTKYGWLKKRIMRFIAKQAGGSTDISKDYEYTDWNQVRQFAENFSLLLKSDKEVFPETLSRDMNLE